MQVSVQRFSFALSATGSVAFKSEKLYAETFGPRWQLEVQCGSTVCASVCFGSCLFDVHDVSTLVACLHAQE